MRVEKRILFYTLLGEMVLSLLTCVYAEGWEPVACFIGSSGLMVFLLWSDSQSDASSSEVNVRIAKLEELQRRSTIGKIAG